MKTVITVIVIVAILVFALKGSVKHMKGEGDCCGGGSGNKPKKVKAKHLEDPVIGQITLHFMQRGGKSRLSGAFGLGHKINFTCLIVSTMILS